MVGCAEQNSCAFLFQGLVQKGLAACLFAPEPRLQSSSDRKRRIIIDYAAFKKKGPRRLRDPFLQKAD
jgi:hypothetical protein